MDLEAISQKMPQERSIIRLDIEENSELTVYLDWESSLQHIQKVLDIYVKNYFSPVKSVYIILNPIKCTYSSDYFKNGDELYFILGTFRIKAVLHEFLHHVVYHIVQIQTH